MAQGSWRWGILGAGAAANGMAAALQAVNGGIQAIASRREETARTLAGRYGIDRVHASPEAMLQDPDLDVIYIASPHDSHHAWMKAAVQAGKHVLCEKAITLNARQLAEVVLLARAALFRRRAAGEDGLPPTFAGPVRRVSSAPPVEDEGQGG